VTALLLHIIVFDNNLNHPGAKALPMVRLKNVVAHAFDDARSMCECATRNQIAGGEEASE
jgi:hypothetical protein